MRCRWPLGIFRERDGIALHPGVGHDEVDDPAACERAAADLPPPIAMALRRSGTMPPTRLSHDAREGARFDVGAALAVADGSARDAGWAAGAGRGRAEGTPYQGRRPGRCGREMARPEGFEPPTNGFGSRERSTVAMDCEQPPEASRTPLAVPGIQADAPEDRLGSLRTEVKCFCRHIQGSKGQLPSPLETGARVVWGAKFNNTKYIYFSVVKC